MHVSKKAGHFDKLCDRLLVEISGLEPELAEPKSVVLPLHHTSIPFIKVFIFFRICKPYGLNILLFMNMQMTVAEYNNSGRGGM